MVLNRAKYFKYLEIKRTRLTLPPSEFHQVVLKIKINLNFIFTLCGASKGFMKAFKVSCYLQSEKI